VFNKGSFNLSISANLKKESNQVRESEEGFVLTAKSKTPIVDSTLVFHYSDLIKQ
jgi:hypothetical protein